MCTLLIQKIICYKIIGNIVPLLRFSAFFGTFCNVVCHAKEKIKYSLVSLQSMPQNYRVLVYFKNG